MKKVLFLLKLLVTVHVASAQVNNQDIDPKWDKYYTEKPTDIEIKYKSDDFTKVIKLVDFVPQSKYFKTKRGTQLLLGVLLTRSEDELRQLRIDGKYYSKTYKHDDYYLLYNKTYKQISKETWDTYCPYLIPLMGIDELIELPSVSRLNFKEE
jgi:hypothetical protein